jgi:hypothetical protein
MLTCLGIALATALCLPSDPVPVSTYIGRDSQLHIRIPRIVGDSSRTAIDGMLDEPAWSHAAVLTGFSQFSPQDGVPAADSTRVLIWYSANALYVGVRAYENHGAVHATLADRDKIAADDNVQLILGTFHDHRQAYVFAVNPFGVQMDGTIIETGRPNSGGFAPALAGRTAPDLNQDFVFSSKGHLTTFGYEVELRIPFKSLKYQSTDVQSWDINVVREVQHSGYEDSWVPAKRSRASFLAQSGSIDELAGFDRGIVLDMNPVVTRKATGGQVPLAGVTPIRGRNLGSHRAGALRTISRCPAQCGRISLKWNPMRVRLCSIHGARSASPRSGRSSSTVSSSSVSRTA